jgi:pimeloyl-ACP methyl ester carboxylesterase
MRKRLLACAAMAAAWSTPAQTVGRPGITPVACPQQTWEPGDARFDALPGAKAFYGRYDGGLYRIEIPDKWNGELMLSSHGYVANSGPQGSRLRVGNPGIREHLIQEGFAWAASSYRCNGYIPGIGLQDTMALTDLFTKFNNGNAPRRVYLTGTSMGGHVTLLGMHEFPTAFAGGLAMCPAGPELFDYFTAVAAGAEAITGVPLKDTATLQASLARIAEIAGRAPDYTDKGRLLASLEIELSGGPRPFAVEGLASGNRFSGNISSGAAALAGSPSPSSRVTTNAAYRYTVGPGLGLTADRLNAMVRRKQADPSVRNPMGPYDELVPFDGRIQRPVLTMHGTGDLFVPIHLERTLNRAVSAAGTSNLLVQRIYRIAGHCQFSVPEQLKAFDDLVTWVRDGVKPKGDDIMADFHDAGRTFTNPLRPNDPGTLTVAATATSTGSARR